MKTKYFVTQSRPASSPAYRHIAVSTASMQILLAKQLTLYEGEDKPLAIGVAENLRSGHLIGYEHDTEKGRIKVTRLRYENGQSQPADRDFPANFELDEKNPAANLEGFVRSGFHGPSRMDLFRHFSPEEIQYLDSFERVRQEVKSN